MGHAVREACPSPHHPRAASQAHPTPDLPKACERGPAQGLLLHVSCLVLGPQAGLSEEAGMVAPAGSIPGREALHSEVSRGYCWASINSHYGSHREPVGSKPSLSRVSREPASPKVRASSCPANLGAAQSAPAARGLPGALGAHLKALGSPPGLSVPPWTCLSPAQQAPHVSHSPPAALGG